MSKFISVQSRKETVYINVAQIVSFMPKSGKTLVYTTSNAIDVDYSCKDFFDLITNQ